MSFQIYDKKLKQYQDQLHSIDEGLAEGFHKRPRRASGAESVKNELDALNRQYIDQVLWANTRLKDISAIFSDANIDMQVSIQKDNKDQRISNDQEQI